MQKTVTLTSGTLSSLLTEKEKNTITSLTLIGTVDAREFRTMRLEMPNLVMLDLSQTTIEAFTDSTDKSREIVIYPANTIPTNQSWNADHLTRYALAGHPNLSIVKLPASLTAIGSWAFMFCSHLSSIELPSSVTNIGIYAFFACRSLSSINIPSPITQLRDGTFSGCTDLKTVYCYAVNPPDMAKDYSSYGVFSLDTISSCILNVPYGTKERYKNAGAWGLFKNIVEMPGFSLSTNHINFEAEEDSTSTLEIISSVPWAASSDQSWLRVCPAYGTGSQTITFTTKANQSDTSLMATVTVSSPGIEPHLIIVTQRGLTTWFDEIAKRRLLLHCYPNPFTSEMAIEVENPLLKKVTIEIYSISGQKIKTLARGQKGAKITLSWDGTNEQGQQVEQGIYLCRMNGQVIKILKGR